MHNFKNLKVWQKAIDLTVDTYKFTKNFPAEEKFGLTGQIRRAAVSIPSNIAEGSGRNGRKEFGHFLSIALGSSFEVETQFIIADKLEIIVAEDFKKSIANVVEVQRMLYAFSSSLNA